MGGPEGVKETAGPAAGLSSGEGDVTVEARKSMARSRPVPLTEPEIVEALATTLDGWTRRGDELVRVYEARDFPAAIRLVDEVALLAEEADHHPDIDIRWRTVTFALCTHSEGSRITELDVAMATRINAAIAAGADSAS